MKTKTIRFVLVTLLGTSGMGAGGGAAWGALPDGFQDQVVVSGLSQPASLDFLPDGRVLVVEQRTGNVRLVVDTTLVGSPVLTVSDVNSGANERGLLGVAVDFWWPHRPYVYLFFNRTPGSVMYLSRFTATGDLTDGTSTNFSLGNRYDILTDIPDIAGNHNAGTLRFGPDCKLYASLGDDNNACAAQDSSDLRGVVLRMNISALPDSGTGPPAKSVLVPGDNPFSSPDPNVGLTFCYGLRNPFRFHIDPVTGKLYIGDVGLKEYEEMDESSGGENFGWPFREGPTVRTQGGCAEPGGSGASTYDAPIGGFDRSLINPASIIAGPRYRPPDGGEYSFPSLYDGVVFYSEYYSGFVRALQDTGGGWAPLDSVPGQPNATDWATGVTSVGDFRQGPDGAIYYVKQFPGELRRIAYSSNPIVIPESPVPARQILAVRPNPYRPEGSLLSIEPIPSADPGWIHIYAPSGKRVRSLTIGLAGEPVTWDGRDDRGRRVPAGIYFVSQSGGKRAAAARVAVLR